MSLLIHNKLFFFLLQVTVWRRNAQVTSSNVEKTGSAFPLGNKSFALKPITFNSFLHSRGHSKMSWSYKRVLTFRVHCLFTSQYKESVINHITVRASAFWSDYVLMDPGSNPCQVTIFIYLQMLDRQLEDQ